MKNVTELLASLRDPKTAEAIAVRDLLLSDLARTDSVLLSSIYASLNPEIQGSMASTEGMPQIPETDAVAKEVQKPAPKTAPAAPAKAKAAEPAPAAGETAKKVMSKAKGNAKNQHGFTEVELDDEEKATGNKWIEKAMKAAIDNPHRIQIWFIEINGIKYSPVKLYEDAFEAAGFKLNWAYNTRRALNWLAFHGHVPKKAR